MPATATMCFDRFRMRRIREARSLSRGGLAALCPNVSVAAIQAYEQGRNKPDVDRALELARALGVTVEKLAGPMIEGARDAERNGNGAD